MAREIEIHGTEEAVKEDQWRKHFGIPQDQTTLFPVMPS